MDVDTKDAEQIVERTKTTTKNAAMISSEDFFRMQEQLIELRNQNYTLMEALKHQKEINSFTKNKAVTLATTLIGHRRDKDKDYFKLEQDLYSLQQKLASQEEDFRLQQETILNELNKLAKRNEVLENELRTAEANLSIFAEEKIIPEGSTGENLIVLKRVLSYKDKMSNMKKEVEAAYKSMHDEFARNLNLTDLLAEKTSEIESLNEKLREKVDTSSKSTQIESEEDSDTSCIVKQAPTEEYKELLESMEKKERKLQEIYVLFDHMESQLINANEKLGLAEKALDDNQCEFEGKLKAKDIEFKVALKKQSSLIKELRRQVQSEKKRAEQAERQVNELLENAGRNDGVRFRIGGSPGASSDHLRSRNKCDSETASSMNSWAFVADKNLAHSVGVTDADLESSCSASILETDNAELITRLALMQKKHDENFERLVCVEEENKCLQKTIAEKSEIIENFIRSIPCGTHQSQNPTPRMRLQQMIDLVRVDDSAAGIRDMNRRLQLLLEETLSKNIMLQKNMQLLIEQSQK